MRINNEEILSIAKIPAIKWQNLHTGKVIDLKPASTEDIYFFVCGNDWSNLTRGLYGKISRQELLTEGWKILKFRKSL